MNLVPPKPEGVLHVAGFQNPAPISGFMDTAHFEIQSKAKSPLSYYF